MVSTYIIIQVAMVAGYGDVGKGSAQSLRGFGCRVGDIVNVIIVLKLASIIHFDSDCRENKPICR